MGDLRLVYSQSERERTIKECLAVVEGYLEYGLRRIREMPEGRRKEWMRGRCLGVGSIRREFLEMLEKEEGNR